MQMLTQVAVSQQQQLGGCLLVELQLLHVCNDSLVLRQPAAIHVGTPL